MKWIPNVSPYMGGVIHTISTRRDRLDIMAQSSSNPPENVSPKARLRLARERCGKSPEEIAGEAGVNSLSYYDLEWVDGEIESAISLRVLQTICARISIQSSELFSDKPIASVDKTTPDGVVSGIKEHLATNHQSISEFEMIIGFEIGQCLENTSLILEWDIECLQYVCSQLGLDWKLALP